MAIDIVINDEPMTLPCSIPLTQAIRLWELTPNTFAIAINESFIAKTQYDCTWLNAGDRIEIVTAMQGG